MTQLQPLENAIRDEFSCHYLPEELPPQWDELFLSRDLPAKAEKSAKRLRHKLGADQAQELAVMLREAANSSAHSLVTLISDVTSVDWTEEQDWPVLQTLLRSIANKI